MHQHIADGGDLAANVVFHAVGDVVRALDGHLRVHLDMHVYEVIVAYLAYEAFFHAIHSRDGLGDAANLLNDLMIRRGVHEFTEGGAEQSQAVPGDDTGSHDGGDVIGRLITFTANEGDADANPGGERADGIAPM